MWKRRVGLPAAVRLGDQWAVLRAAAVLPEWERVEASPRLPLLSAAPGDAVCSRATCLGPARPAESHHPPARCPPPLAAACRRSTSLGARRAMAPCPSTKWPAAPSQSGGPRARARRAPPACNSLPLPWLVVPRCGGRRRGPGLPCAARVLATPHFLASASFSCLPAHQLLS